MARPTIPESAKKTAYAVSLSMAERKLFQHMGGSAYLQGVILKHARMIVDDGMASRMPSGGTEREEYKAAQDVIQAHVERGTPKTVGLTIHEAPVKHDALTPLQKHMAYVRKKYPKAACKRDGISWAIYNDPKAPDRFQITGGWMTPPQAWERASAAIDNPKPYQRNAPAKKEGMRLSWVKRP